MHTVEVHIPKNCKNKIPVFVLPDATGTSKEQLVDLCDQLERPILFFRDIRLDHEEEDTDLSSLGNLALSYALTITNCLQAIADPSLDNESEISINVNSDKISFDKETDPILVIGYSAGANALTLIIDYINNKISIDNTEKEFQAAIRYLRDRNILPIYLDPVAPHKIREWDKKEFLKHLAKVIDRIQGLYDRITINTIVHKGKMTKFPEHIETLSPLELCDWFNKKLGVNVDGEGISRVESKNIFGAFDRATNTLLRNNLAVAEYKKEMKIDKGVVIAAQKTYEQYTDKTKDGNNSISGFTIDTENTHIKILQGADHFEMLEDEKFINEAATLLSSLLGDDKQLSLELLKQKSHLAPEIERRLSFGYKLATIFSRDGADQSQVDVWKRFSIFREEKRERISPKMQIVTKRIAY